MSTYLPSPRPDDTIWGSIQQAEQIIPGVWSVSTSSHGGFILSDQRQAAMPEALSLPGPSYEEDCDWALPVLAFEQEFRSAPGTLKGWIELAHDTARCWHPDRYGQFTGVPVEENQSHILRDRNAYKAAIGKLEVTSAWGSWASWVPEGKTGVVAHQIDSVNHLARPTHTGQAVYALVDAEAYKTRSSVCILDDLPHEIIETPEDMRPKQIA
ncbi:DUF7007 domain-containing protein [Croceicoccus mobilis]|uniref:DUF7007 domain-containing protein n=1 Tax=Croceicoccus mobilis TaxID=1703339 RepID=A0A916Z9C4_9SPHN|nr:hypothetical protein [Croceicoccus mobilis]GGD82326.1 hypothetical protein GCM10010990_35440 [Croceicoccus mobilis]